MTDTNYISSIVKILENPKQTLFKNTILVTEFRVQLPQVGNNIIVDLVVWDKLGKDVINYYKLNDYIIIEGYLSFSDKRLSSLINNNSEVVRITVLKIYPFLLSYNSPLGKI